MRHGQHATEARASNRGCPRSCLNRGVGERAEQRRGRQARVDRPARPRQPLPPHLPHEAG
eukprot:2007149-Prymnesium_polylepis.1